MAEFYGIRARSRVQALHHATANAKHDVMKKLLSDGVDVNEPGSDGDTALHVAAKTYRVNAVKLLLEENPKLNRTNENHLTPLMVACSRGAKSGSRIAMLLIEAGADVRYVRKSDEMTALMFAVKRCAPDVIQALIDHGARIDGPRGSAQTPLMLAARANNVDSLKVLVRNGANITRKCKLRWAENRTAEGLAEMERRTKALRFLREL